MKLSDYFSIFDDSFIDFVTDTVSEKIKKKESVYTLELPGVKKEDISITISQIRNFNYLAVEYKHRNGQTYKYTTPISGNLKISNPTAEYENGLLVITFDKKEECEPVKINIK